MVMVILSPGLRVVIAEKSMSRLQVR